MNAKEVLKFAELQAAAEAFLDGVTAETSPTALAQLLEQGNGHATAFPSVQAAQFAQSWVVVAHLPNTPTGFSGTLFRSRDPSSSGEHEYTLSLRSTEFVDDAIRDSTGTNDLEIRQLGWAFGQIADMEAWYKELKAAGEKDPSKGLPPNVAFNVTGYSLGGHLASAFGLLRRQSPVSEEHLLKHVYTFNGAGTGGVDKGYSLWAAVDLFEYLRDQPAGSGAPTSLADARGALERLSSVLSELRRLDAFEHKALTFSAGEVPPIGGFGSFPYQLAAVKASLHTTPASVTLLSENPIPLSPKFASTQAFDRFTEIVGADGGQFGTNFFDGRFSFVSFSGLHYSKPENYQGVYIEDQPLWRGNYNLARDRGKLVDQPNSNNFADTHSLVLLVDSLSLMAAITQLDHTISQLQIEEILRTATNSKAKSRRGTNGEAEGNTLESVLDGLRRLFVGPNVAVTPSSLAGNTWHELEMRKVFHANLRELTMSATFQSFAGHVSVRPMPVGAKEIEDLANVSLAYRYALKELNPFVVVGDNALYEERNRHGELELFDRLTGEGALTSEYIADRARQLAALLKLGTANSRFLPNFDASGSHRFADVSTGGLVRLLGDGHLQIAQQFAASPDGETKVDRLLDRIGYERQFLFGANSEDFPDRLRGDTGDDSLYGGTGSDVLQGDDGSDYLQGDAGDDRLHGNSGNDRLVGGKGNDMLHGGTGTDKYYFYTGGGTDTVIDEAEIVSGTKRQLGEIYFGGAGGDERIQGTFTPVDPDGKHYTRAGAEGKVYRAAYLGDVASVTPGKLVLWREDDGSNIVTLDGFISGDFGIVLDPNAPQRPNTDKFGTELPDNEFLIGVPHASSLSSDSPDQKVFGLGGADRIHALHANAQAIGGEGNDYAFNGEGDQSLFGEGGRDVLVASAGDDWLEGGADDDALQGGADADYLDGGAGNDVLDGGAGADVIAGGEGHDFIFGGGSATVFISNWDAFADGSLDWGAVDASGNASIRGLVGVSNVEGDAGDVITAGPGNDWVFAGDGLDVVSAGEGNDYVVGQAGGDSLSGDEGEDRLYGDGAEGDLVAGTGFFSVFTLPQAHGDDALRGGAGNDFLSGDGGADELHGDEGDDTLVGDSANVAESFHGADYLDGGAGNDILLGYGKGDSLFGGAGNDMLGGDASSIADSLHGEDYLDGEDGDDTLHGDGGDDRLFGGTGNDILDGDASNVAFEFHGDDYLDGEEGNDALQGGGGADWLFGGVGNDSLLGDGPAVPGGFAGDDYLDGEAGSDVLEGGAGNDTLIGGAGSDILRGQAGDDLYVVATGDQQDFVQDHEGQNTIRFDSGGTFAGMSVFQSTGSDGKVYLEIRHTPLDSVYVQDGLTNSSLRYEFADGTVRTAADWRSKFTSFTTISGTSGADDLPGTARAESYSPGNGNDTIRFAPGAGFDRVSGFGQVTGESPGIDVVRVGGGLTAADLDVRRDSSGHLYITLRGTGDVLRLDNWATNSGRAHAGHQMVFDDGTGLAAADLIAMASAGTEGADFLAGGSGADVIEGGAGDDRLFGNSSANPQGGAADANVLLGGAGNDQLTGGFGNDLLDGGEGDDTLSGGSGADTYRWGAGDGNDVIADGRGEGNVVEMKPGTGPQDVTLVQGSIVIYAHATGESLTLKDWYGETGLPSGHVPYVSVEELRFADGTVWDASLINEMANHATPFDDSLRGIFTADVLHGLGGNDLLEGYSGDDVLIGGGGDDVLRGDLGADELIGGAGNDVLDGGAGPDLLVGGAGDDLLSGHGGQNMYRFGPGDGTDRIVAMGEGDIVEFAQGVDSSSVQLRSDGTTLTVDYGSGRFTILLGTTGNHASHGIEEARFADGTAWAREEILSRTQVVPRSLVGTPDADNLVGGGNDEFIDGGAADDSLSGGAGDDTLLGGAGVDLLQGGAGNDYLDGGAGNDQMNGGLGSDIYRLGLDTGDDTLLDALLDPFHTWSWPGDVDVIAADDGILPAAVGVSRSGDNLVLATPASSIAVLNWFAGEFVPGPLALRFADGSEWDTGALMALAGVAPPGGLDDVVMGTPGDDLLEGGYGNDTYHFGFGSGSDTIREHSNTLSGELNRATAGARDVIRIGPGIAPQDVFVTFNSNRPTFNLVGSADTVTVETWSDAAAGRIEFAEFDDGTVWDLGRFDHWGGDSQGGVGLADIATGSSRHFPGDFGGGLGLHDETYLGQAANDIVSDSHGHQSLYGGAGNDTLSAGSGDDVIDGGAGIDSLAPGTGDNRIRFGRGYGQDTLHRSALPSVLGVDIIVLGEDVIPAHVRLRRGPGESLILELAGTTDSLRVNGPLRGLPGRDRLRFEFADGMAWGPDEIEAHIQAVALIEGGTGNNVLTGGDGDDLFVGGEGNDTLIGGGGNDTFLFHRGDGADTVSDKHPRVRFGDAIAPGDVTLTGTNFAAGQRNLLLTISGNAGQLTLGGWFDTAGIDGSIEFADGTVWDAAAIGAQVPFAWTSGTSGSFFGTSGKDAYSSGNANDTMRGHGGDDALSGNDGNDQVFGGDGNDILSGGAGNDTLQGEAGEDALHGGDGNDALSGGADADMLHGEGGDDQLSGGSGGDLVVGGTGKDQLAGGLDDDELHGGDGDDLLEGGLGNDFLDGSLGDDRLYGGAGSDTYAFGIGFEHDTLVDYDGTGVDVDTVVLGEGIAPEDLVVTRQAGDILVTLGASGDSLTIRSFGGPGYGIELLVFADGTEWSGEALAARAPMAFPRARADVIHGTEQAEVLSGLDGDDFVDGSGGDDLLEGGSGDDVLWGGSGDDTLDGGAGADHLTGGEGADLFLVRADSGSDSIADLTEGDALHFGPGIAPAAARIVRDVENLYLEIDATGQFVTLENWFALGAGGEVLFDDGTRWDGAHLESHVNALTAGDDFIVGSAAGDSIAPLAGLDIVHAGDGDDLVSGGAGSDTLHGEAGADSLYGESGYDLLVGGAGGDLLDGGEDDDALYGDEGNDVLRGGEGYDELTGDEGDDLLEGGAGDDLLQGGLGSDIYVFAPGFGADELVDTSAANFGTNIARFSGFDPAALSFVWDAEGFLLEIEGSTDTLLMRDSQMPHFLGVDTIEFDGGTAWARSDVYLRTTRIGTAGNDVLAGNFRAMLGLGGNDAMTGGLLNDMLDGGEGRDTLDGRQGDDLLIGGSGGDTYRFGPTFGHDVIQDNDAGVADADTVILNAAPSDAYVFRSGQDIMIELSGGADTLTLQSWYDGAAHQIEILRFSNGMSWDAQTLQAHASSNPIPEHEDVGTSLTEALAIDEAEPEPAQAEAPGQIPAAIVAMQGFSSGPDFVRGTGGDDLLEAMEGDDSAYGGPGDDVVLGGEGDDYLGGEAGDDLLDGGAGRDILEGGPGNDSYAFGAGYGEDWAIDTGGVDEVLFDESISPTGVAFSRDLSNLYVAAGSDRLTLVDWFHRAETRIETFRFAAGAVIDEAAVRLALVVPAASAAHDTIFGSDRSETLLGLAGEDTLLGDGGDDVLDGGAGSDYMMGGAGDDTYHVDNRFDRATERAGEGMDTVFASASHVLTAELENLTLAGTSAINGTGNAGANAITGNAAANVLRGAAGDDLLRGGAGNDIYLYDSGDGADRIEDDDATLGNSDELRFGAGIVSTDVRVRRVDEALHLAVRNGDEITLVDWFDPAFRVEIVRFADGTAWDATMLERLASLPWNEPPVLAQSIADTAAQEDFPFTLMLQPGTFSDPDAADVLVYSAARADDGPLPVWLQFDVQNASFSGTPANEDVGEYTIRVVATDPAGESVADEFMLQVVNVNDAPALLRPVADQSVAAGSAFALTLDAGMFADVDAGDVLAYGATRADGAALPAWLTFDAGTGTFSGAPVDADSGAFDIRVTATDLDGAFAIDDFRVTVAPDGGGGEHLIGTRHADILIGSGGDDTLEGRRGNDFLLGLKGDDAYVYQSGDGHDWVLESGGADVVRFGAGIRERDVAAMRRHGDLVLKVKGNQGSVTVKGWFLADGKRVERVEFANGRAWGEDELRSRANRRHDDGWFDTSPHDHHRDHDRHHERRAGHGHGRGKERDDGRAEPRDACNLIEARLKRAAAYDFNDLAAQLRRNRTTGELSAGAVVARWDAIRRVANLLAHDTANDFNHGGADGWNYTAYAQDGGGTAGWGHAGSTGQSAGFAGLRAFDGLDEGFRRLG